MSYLPLPCLLRKCCDTKQHCARFHHRWIAACIARILLEIAIPVILRPLALVPLRFQGSGVLSPMRAASSVGSSLRNWVPAEYSDWLFSPAGIRLSEAFPQ